MVTLQLKDICGYIPYDLIGQSTVGKTLNRIISITKGDYNELIRIMPIEKGNDFPIHVSNIKPILYPIDYLYKPMIKNGEEIIPIVELAKITMQDAIRKEYWKPEDFVLVGDKVKLGNYTFFYEKRECFSWSYKYSDLNDQTALYQLQIFDLIHELKIDIRGLIPQGLAVSVDELEVNPYK